MQVYATDFASRGKADASPVTEADEQAEALILAQLRSLTPQIPIVSEEAASAGHTGYRRALLAGGSARWHQGIHQPQRRIHCQHRLDRRRSVRRSESCMRRLSAACSPESKGRARGSRSPGTAARIACRRVPSAGLTVVSSRSHGDATALDRFLSGRRVGANVNAGSSLKFCLVAAGEADLYPRLGRTMEWDTAAGDAVLRAAGGRVTELDGRELRYGKPGFANPHFVAAGLTE